MPDMLAEALSYAERGWFVFPCRERPSHPYMRDEKEIIHYEKTPYTTHGLDDATLDKDQIHSWWKRYPNAMIGINCEKSGLFVVDIDNKHVNGMETYTLWNINDVAGLRSTTPSGGIHIVFTGKGKSSTNGKTGIDTRGEGGYFIAPPSEILEGEHTGKYVRENDWTRTPGVIPDGLMSKLFPNKTYEYVKGISTPAVAGERKILSNATFRFLKEGAPEGQRNDTLFKALADFAGCGYSKEEARERVDSICKAIGLTEEEVEKVFRNAYAKDRTPSIPDEIQEKIKSGGKDLVSKITVEEEIAIENALLACLMVDNNLIPAVQDILGYEDFKTIKGQEIYRAINFVHASGLKADIVTVSEQISKKTNKFPLDDVSRFVSQYSIDIENAISYAYIIKEKACIRKVEALMDNKDKYLKSPNFFDMVTTLEKDISDIAVSGGAKSTSVLNSKQATDLVRERTQMIKDGRIEQLKIGFSLYDNFIGGLYSNELVICAGRAGDGKSALALSIVKHVALVKQNPVALFSLEMSTHESISRLICQTTELHFKDVYQGKLSEKEWVKYGEAMAEIAASGIYFDDTYGISVPELRSKIRRLMDKGIKLIVIDQLEQIKGYESQPAYIKLDRIAYDIKNLTQEFNVPIILNHQLNRNITDRKLKNPEPQLSDLNQAGEKPANQVWVIHHTKDEHSGEIVSSKIRILKNRNGARIDFPVQFFGEKMLFADIATPRDALQHKGNMLKHKDINEIMEYNQKGDNEGDAPSFIDHE